MNIDFQGTVTDVNLEYCKFVLDKKITIHAGYLFATSNEIKIPIINSWVIITGCKQYKNTLFLESTSNIFGDKYVSKENTEQCEPFIKLIREHKLNFFDMMYIENIIEKLEKDKVFSSDFLTLRNVTQIVKIKDLILKTIPYIALKVEYNTLFDASQLDTHKILTPRDHKFEQGAEEINCKIYWSHGVQAFKNKECLIGLLRISSDMGFIILQDAFYFIVCEIAPDNRAEFSLKLSKLLNNFVLIQNYHIFLERTTDNPMIHYIFVNIRDVQILLSISKEITPELKTDKVVTIHLKIIHRCTVSIKNQYLNCWIQCKIKTQNSNIFRECFFILHGKHFTKYPLMNPDDEYILSSTLKSFDKEMTEFKSRKYYTVNGANIPVFWIPIDAKLTLITNVKSNLVNAIAQDFSFLSIPEAVEVLQMNKRKHEENKLSNNKTVNDLLTFEAIIKKRRTVSPNRYTRNQVDHKCFGIRGKETHQIILKPLNQVESPTEITRGRIEYLNQQRTQAQVYECENLEKAERLYQENLIVKPPQEETTSLYLHNWQELQLPLGLIHGMKVAVRNVMNPKGSKYVKPTFLTRIEPMAYLPEQEFETAFEFLNNTNWGPSTTLSASHGIPANIVCWAPALTLHFTALTIYMRCPTCRACYVPGQQTCCKSEDQQGLKCDMLLALRGRDNKGVFDAVSREDKVLRMLLGVREKQWGFWKKAFEVLKWWTMQPNDWQEKQDDCCYAFRTYQQELIAETLTNKIVSFNKQGFHKFDIKCRKLEKNDRDFNLNQKWYIVDIRPTNTSKEPYELLYFS